MIFNTPRRPGEPVVVLVRPATVPDTYGEAVRADYGEAACCRTWPVILGVRLGRCGLCGMVPFFLP